MVSAEVRLVLYVLGLYGAFMCWGYLQERITSTNYSNNDSSGGDIIWAYPVALNTAMAAATFITAGTIELFQPESKSIPLVVYWYEILMIVWYLVLRTYSLFIPCFYNYHLGNQRYLQLLLRRLDMKH
jgi:hypothetical protein